MPLGSAWSNGAAGVHRCGILRRLEWRWGCCELLLRSTPRYRLVCNWFPAPGGGLPVGTWAWDFCSPHSVAAAEAVPLSPHSCLPNLCPTHCSHAESPIPPSPEPTSHAVSHPEYHPGSHPNVNALLCFELSPTPPPLTRLGQLALVDVQPQLLEHSDMLLPSMVLK